MSHPFMLGEWESRNESSDDDVMDESEFEHLCSVGGGKRATSMHYWYGKIYFAHRLAKEITQQASSTTSGSDLDFALMRRMTEFPYAARLAKSHQLGASHLSGPRAMSDNHKFCDFVTAVGALAQSEDTKSKQDLDSLMMDEETPIPVEESIPARQQSPRIVQPPSEQPESMGLNSTPLQADPELPRYTMALKEYGDCAGTEPVYKVEQLSLHPPLFRMIVRVALRSFEGQANTKKQAKHLASQKACHYLGLTL